MSKILYCGDPHGEFRHIVRAAEHSTPVRSCCSATSSRCGRPTRSWRPSRRRSGSSTATTTRIPTPAGRTSGEGPLAERNIHGQVVTLPDGTRLAGLGCMFRESMWNPALSTPPRFRTPAEHDAATPRWDGWRGGRPEKTGPPSTGTNSTAWPTCEPTCSSPTRRRATTATGWRFWTRLRQAWASRSRSTSTFTTGSIQLNVGFGVASGATRGGAPRHHGH
jgi:hypothetical protein